MPSIKPTIRNKFHALGNWHNKMSLAAIVSKESLADKEIAKLSGAKIKEILKTVNNNLAKIEEYVIEADKIVEEIKPFIYEKIGPEMEVPVKKDLT